MDCMQNRASILNRSDHGSIPLILPKFAHHSYRIINMYQVLAEWTKRRKGGPPRHVHWSIFFRVNRSLLLAWFITFVPFSKRKTCRAFSDIYVFDSIQYLNVGWADDRCTHTEWEKASIGWMKRHSQSSGCHMRHFGICSSNSTSSVFFMYHMHYLFPLKPCYSLSVLTFRLNTCDFQPIHSKTLYMVEGWQMRDLLKYNLWLAMPLIKSTS